MTADQALAAGFVDENPFAEKPRPRAEVPVAITRAGARGRGGPRPSNSRPCKPNPSASEGAMNRASPVVEPVKTGPATTQDPEEVKP